MGHGNAKSSDHAGKSAGIVEAPPYQSHRSDSNRRPAVYKTAADSVQPLNSQQVSDFEVPAGTTGGTKNFPDLIELNDYWDDLPAVVRTGIMALARAAVAEIQQLGRGQASVESREADDA